MPFIPRIKSTYPKTTYLTSPTIATHVSETSILGPYRVHCHVASHVARCDSIQHSGPSHGTQALGGHVENGAEKRHLRANKVGKGNGRVNVTAADMANGLDEGGSCQTEAQGHM